jgi:hypothetical protein
VAEQVAYDEWACIDQYDISGRTSNFGSERMVDLKDFTTFPEPTVVSPAPLPYKKRLAGPESAKMSIAGYLDMDVNHPALSAAFAASPIITKGEGRALGSSVLMYVGREGTFSYGGPVGDVIPITAEIGNDGAVTPGSLFEFGSKTATGNGTSRTISAVTTGKVLVLHAHVISVSGTASPSITIIYETSAIGDYTDAVTKHTFATFTTANKERAVKTAAISDTNGRFRWTITGTDPVFLVRLSAGVR